MATGATCRYDFYKVSQVVVSGIFENTAMLMDFELIQAPKTLKKLGARARGQAHRKYANSRPSRPREALMGCHHVRLSVLLARRNRKSSWFAL